MTHTLCNKCNLFLPYPLADPKEDTKDKCLTTRLKSAHIYTFSCAEENLANLCKTKFGMKR